MKQNHDEWETNMPAQFRTELSNVRSSVAPGESMKRFMLAAEEVELTVAAMKRASTNANRFAIAGCLIVLIGTLSLIAWYQVGLLIASIVVSYAFSTIGFILVLIRYLRDKRIAGAILLDCGRMKTSGLVFLLLAILPLSIVLMTCVDFNTTPWYYWVLGVTLCMPLAIYFTSIALGRFQVRANGIWHYIGLLPWHEIESWGWTGESDTTLLIIKNGGWLFSRRGVFHIRNETKEQVEEYLLQYCVERRKRD
jgi:hypothetical protein